MALEHNYPLRKLRKNLENLLLNVQTDFFPNSSVPPSLEISPNRAFCDLFSTISFQIAKMKSKNKKEYKRQAMMIADLFVKELSAKKIPLIEKIENKNGYINFFIDYTKFSGDVIKSIISLNEKYGHFDLGRNKNVIIEHTSPNPIHPIHIGTARNSVLGDALSRLFRFVGYNVKTRMYVDDMGRQVAYLAYGISKLPLEPYGKKDHWIGMVYSCVATISEILKYETELMDIKKRLLEFLNQLDESLLNEKEIPNTKLIKTLKKISRNLKRYPTINWIEKVEIIFNILKDLLAKNQINRISTALKEKLIGFFDFLKEVNKKINNARSWFKVHAELRERWPLIFNHLRKKIVDLRTLENEVSSLMIKYENGDPEVKKLFRKICNDALEGFLETLNRVSITFDGFDWESDLVWDGKVKAIINRLKNAGWIIYDEETGVPILDIRRALQEVPEVREIFDLSLEKISQIIKANDLDSLPPNLVLMRKDGTTLYTTRDIAYAIEKISRFKADLVLNVIGADQTLPQKQLRSALVLAGFPDYAKKIIHVAYELVQLPSAKISARRGRFIAFDEILDEAEEKAYEFVATLPNKAEEEKLKIAKAVAVGAVRYALLSSAPTRPMIFDWDRVLNLESNSGPFLQYSYARAVSILRKAEFKLPQDADFSTLIEDIEKEIILRLSLFPDAIESAVRQMRPDIIVEYANKLAIAFNSFYQRFPVLRAKTTELRNARLLLVEAFRITLRNALSLLGIPILERM